MEKKLKVRVDIIPEPNEGFKAIILEHLKNQTEFSVMVNVQNIPLKHVLYYLEIYNDFRAEFVYISDRQISVC